MALLLAERGATCLWGLGVQGKPRDLESQQEVITQSQVAEHIIGAHLPRFQQSHTLVEEPCAGEAGLVLLLIVSLPDTWSGTTRVYAGIRFAV